MLRFLPPLALLSLLACSGAPSRAPAPAASVADVRAADPALAAGDTLIVERFVRARAGELRFCYEEQGLKLNPDLGGRLTLALTVAPDGRVTSGVFLDRSWSGAGGADVEACMLAKTQAWRVHGVTTGGTFTFPLRFSR